MHPSEGEGEIARVSIGQWAWTFAWTWDMSLDSLVEGDTGKARERENEEVGKESSQL